MPRRLSTVDDLVNEIREQLDELNVDSVSTSGRILPTVNRAQDYAFDMLARRYPEPYLTHAALPLSTAQEYDLPEDCFEDRINRVEIVTSEGSNGQMTTVEVRRVSYYDAWKFESRSPSATPPVYTIVGRKIRFPSAPTGTYPARIWYVLEPEQAVLPQGRITAYNQAGNYIIVDAAGDDLSTEADTLESYVNLVDGQTGVVKWTGQISVIDSEQIIFRTTPIRDTVLNRTVQGTLPLSTDDPTVGLDDYVCNVRGTCVPPSGALRNFLVEFTVAEIVRSLGGDASTEEQMLEKFERQIDKYGTARETTMRVQPRSGAWGGFRRRWFPTQRGG